MGYLVFIARDAPKVAAAFGIFTGSGKRLYFHWEPAFQHHAIEFEGVRYFNTEDPAHMQKWNRLARDMADCEINGVPKTPLFISAEDYARQSQPFQAAEPPPPASAPPRKLTVVAVSPATPVLPAITAGIAPLRLPAPAAKPVFAPPASPAPAPTPAAPIVLRPPPSIAQPSTPPVPPPKPAAKKAAGRKGAAPRALSAAQFTTYENTGGPRVVPDGEE